MSESPNWQQLLATNSTEFTLKDTSSIAAKLRELVPKGGTQVQAANNYELLRVIDLIEEAEKREDTSGFHKWFKDGPYDIRNLPKHKAFFEATARYREVLLLGGNRVGKTRSGATVAAILATGEYPDWWEGVRFDHPTTIWVAGKTGQTTRDTVQEALMGPIGHWGTGALPKESIGRCTARQGIPNAIDTVEVNHVSGGISTIGFKSYDQKPASFYGRAMHLIWLDEPCPDLVYNECLIRTMTTNGRVIHTITPKEGLTRLLAEFLSGCDLLAGSERIKGLDAMIKLEDMENGLGD